MFNIIYLDKVSSTMDVIKTYPFNTVLVANEQTNGRGKDTRQWISEKSNNIYMSIKLKDNCKNPFNYVFLIAVAIANSLKNIDENINIQLKWPNDVLLKEQKISGTIIEIDLSTESIVIGTGINVDFNPQNVMFKATNLKKEGYNIDKKDLIQQILDEFNKYNIDNFDAIRNEWLKFAYNLNKNITVKINNKELNGIFKDLDKEGNLILNTDNGEIKISSGDVF